MSMILRTNNPSVAEGHSNFRKSSDDSFRARVYASVFRSKPRAFAFVRVRSN